jgi:uncharacterized protein YndB with AHSA1/START domain
MTIAPVRRSVRTKAPPARAFEIFTSKMGRWWPRGRSAGANPHADIVIEPFAGGRWYERDEAGAETPWGKVLAWEPPTRLLLAWQLYGGCAYDPELVTEVEITFSPAEGGGAEVVLEHRNLERFRRNAPAWAAAVERGWTEMVQVFADFADRPDQEE